MSDPYGGPFAAWDPGATYAEGDRVSYGGYIYEAMTAISAGDDPRTATYTATLTDSAVAGGTTTATLRRWRIWDYPAGYYLAILRGLPPFTLVYLSGNVPVSNEIRTVIVRTNYQNNGDADKDLYDTPASASYSGYGMPAGMDTNWDDPYDPDEQGKLLVWSFSAARYEDGAPYAYQYNLGAANGLCYQPSTIMGWLQPDGLGDFYAQPAWFDETQGQMVSCYQTFNRDFVFTQPLPPIGPGSDRILTPAFQDNWLANPVQSVPADGLTIATDPDYLSS